MIFTHSSYKYKPILRLKFYHKLTDPPTDWSRLSHEKSLSERFPLRVIGSYTISFLRTLAYNRYLPPARFEFPAKDRYDRVIVNPVFVVEEVLYG